MKTKRRRYKGESKGKKVRLGKLQVHREGSGEQSALGIILPRPLWGES